MSFKDEIKVGDLNSGVIEMVKSQDRVTFVMGALVDKRKFNALPCALQRSLFPYKVKVENQEILNKCDYNSIKDIVTESMTTENDSIGDQR